MLTYDLKVGYSCNNRCKHCVIEDNKDTLINSSKKIDLTTSECLNLIQEQLDINKINRIVLTGGEFTIRKDMNEILAFCDSKGLDITIQTNGRKLSDDKTISLIRTIENITLVVALHGSNSESHDYITKVNGSFNETCMGIKTMRSLNKKIILKVVISKLNQYDLSNIVLLAKEYGVQYINFAFPHAQGAARKNFEEVIPRYSSLKNELEKLIFLAEKNSILVEFETIPFCIIPKHLKLVGEIYSENFNTICTQVKEETYNWNKLRKSIKSKSNRCGNCELNKYCEGVWSEYISNFGDKEFVPIQKQKI